MISISHLNFRRHPASYFCKSLLIRSSSELLRPSARTARKKLNIDSNAVLAGSSFRPSSPRFTPRGKAAMCFVGCVGLPRQRRTPLMQTTFLLAKPRHTLRYFHQHMYKYRNNRSESLREQASSVEPGRSNNAVVTRVNLLHVDLR